MKPSVIVWDLETVPDLGGFAAANDLVGKSGVEVREAIGDKFPKHIYHSIVCIGALIAHWEPNHWAVDAVGAPHVGERTEKELISAFCDKIAELRPRIVLDGAQPARVPDDVIAEIRSRELNGLVQLPKREMFSRGRSGADSARSVRRMSLCWHARSRAGAGLAGAARGTAASRGAEGRC